MLSIERSILGDMWCRALFGRASSRRSMLRHLEFTCLESWWEAGSRAIMNVYMNMYSW